VSPDIGVLPLAPKNPLPCRQQMRCLRTFHTGMQTLRDADGPVTRLELAPNWLMPPVVIATSPQGGVVAVAEQGERRLPHALPRHLCSFRTSG
jgi:hypothetical protein